MPMGFRKDGTKLGFQRGHPLLYHTLEKAIDIRLLKKRYLVDKISTYALQKEFGLSNNSLRKRLIREKIMLRTCSDAQKLIPHQFPINKYGKEGWLAICQSPAARARRAISHIGKKFTEKRKLHIRQGIGRGIRNKLYKGENAKYKAKHIWYNNNIPKTGSCIYCHSKPKPHGGLRVATHWSNLDWKYNREDRKTWIELCPSCNHSYDSSYGFRVKLLNELDISGIDIPTPRQTNLFTS